MKTKTVSDKQMKVVYVAINKLKPATYNPRKSDEQSDAQLKESITKYGLVDPILVNSAENRSQIVIGGHFRLRIAKELGYTEVPVVYLDIPDEAKERELNLRLNRNTGQWDYDLLKSFDLDLLLDVGFDDHDLSSIWDDTLETEDDGFDVEKELQTAKTSKIMPGDLFQLGPHRLICGDSTNAAVVQKLMNNDTSVMIYSDPPYNISLNYHTGIGTNGKYSGINTDDNKTDAQYREFLRQTITNGLAVSSTDCHVFFYCDQGYIGLLQSLYEEVGIANKRVCLWVKNSQNPTPQTAFNKAYEPCVYGTRGKPYLSANVQKFNEILNKEVGTGNRLQDDILDLFDLWLVKRLPGQQYTHPTEKPPTLHEKSLRRCTKPGDVVLDLFGGSGSTLIACEQLKRKAFLVEMEPIFCQLIITRYEKLTGQKAKQLN